MLTEQVKLRFVLQKSLENVQVEYFLFVSIIYIQKVNWLQQYTLYLSWIIDQSSHLFTCLLYNKKMINIELNDFIDWIERKLDEKYSFETEDLKRIFIAFYNLSMQIMQIYSVIKTKIKKLQTQQPSFNKQAIEVIDKSIYILNRMADQFPRCIDYLFIDHFLHVFQDNLNLLCTLYHSLSHALVAPEYKFKLERDKIIQGINRLYQMHKTIKQLSCKYQNILKHISHYLSFFRNKVTSIKTHIEKWQKKQNSLEDFKNSAIDFYKNLQESINKVNNQPSIKRNFMANYFNCLHELYSAQSKLQILLQPTLRFSEDIKMKKKKANFEIQQSATQLLKWMTILLKHHFSIKHVKKIKLEELTKIITSLSREKQYPIELDFIVNIKQIQQTIEIVYSMMCQLEKIQQSGLLGMISEYKDSIMPVGAKKIIPKLIEYQNYKSKYYRIHEQIKMLQKYVQGFVLKQTEQYVNIFVQQFY